MKKIIKYVSKNINKFGWFNLAASKKYRFVHELYEETRTMIAIQPMIKDVFNLFSAEIKTWKDNSSKEDNNLVKPKLFQYWHQGFNNLPKIVKRCYKSVDEILGVDFEIIRINYANLNEFISLPDHIIMAMNEGRMSIAHFSDIIRNKLLLEFGGLWLDSTVLITGKNQINHFISFENRLMFSRFVFSNPNEHAVQFESWIMWSKNRNNLVFKLADKVLTDYWISNKNINNYFLYHIILTSIFLSEPKFRVLFNWNNRFYLGNSLDLLHFKLDETFKLDDLITFFKNTEINKLDFKIKNFKPNSVGDYLYNN
jgi:hypothetical protein